MEARIFVPYALTSGFLFMKIFIRLINKCILLELIISMLPFNNSFHNKSVILMLCMISRFLVRTSNEIFKAS